MMRAWRQRSPTNEAELAELRRQAWQRQGVLTVRPDDVVDPWLQQALHQLAEQLYGRRQPPRLNARR